MLNCMRVVIEDETDLQECYNRFDELEAIGHDANNWSDPVVLAQSQEWVAILNGLLIWEQDHPGTVRADLSQVVTKPSAGLVITQLDLPSGGN